MKKILFPLAALAVFASCVQENNEMTSPQAREVSLVASASETKTLLDGNAVMWETNDAVALVFAKDGSKHVETFTTTESGASAVFSGKLPNEVSVAGGYDASGHAVYPSSAVADDGSVAFSLPAALVANENGSFDSGKNLSSATVSLEELDAAGETSADFRNALSVLRFSLSSGVVSFRLMSESNLAGAAVLDFDAEENDRLKVASWTAPSTELTVTPAGATFTGGQVYNVLVYPGQHQSLTAELTDTDGCRYLKTVEGPFVFEASKFYTFTFATRFEKTYTFTATGRIFAEGDEIMTVFGELHSEVLAAAEGAKFTGNLPAEVVHAGTEGYALYPASAYSAGRISYTLDPLSPAELCSAVLRPTSTTVAFNPVAEALATVKFSVPSGVKSVNIVSDKALAGTAEMTVNAGKLVAGTGDGTEVDVDTAADGSYTLSVYPVTDAALTVTLTDAAGATVEKNLSLTVAAGQTVNLDISGDLSFDKAGNFTNDPFTDGGSYDFD